MTCFPIKKAILWLSISSLVYTIGCATVKIKEGVFSPHDKNYRITIPEAGKGWEPIQTDKADLTLWNKQYKAMIVVISSDIENKGFSLEMLSRHLFLGMAGKKIVSTDPVFLDDQSALHTILEGEMDNCRLMIDSYVIRIEDKVYDLVCWAPFSLFDHIQGDFEHMARSFQDIRK